MREVRNGFIILVMNFKGRSYVRDLCVDGTIKISLKVIECKDWIELAQN
jgi:hypothetical protein